MAFYTYKLYVEALTGTYYNQNNKTGIENVLGKITFQDDDVTYTQFCLSNQLGVLVFNFTGTSIQVTLSRKGYYTQSRTINRDLGLNDNEPHIEHITMYSNGEIASHKRVYQIFPDYFNYEPESAISESERTMCLLSHEYEESLFTQSGNISGIYETYEYPGNPNINYHNRILRTSDILRHGSVPTPGPPDPEPITIRSKVPLNPSIPTSSVTYTLPLIFFFRTSVHAGTVNYGVHHVLKNQFQVSELTQSATTRLVASNDYNWNYPMGTGEWFESNDIETTPWKYVYEIFYENPLLFIYTVIKYYNSNNRGFIVLDKNQKKVLDGGVVTFAGDLIRYNNLRQSTNRYFVTCCYARGAAPHNPAATECWNDGMETYRTNASALQLPVSGTLNSSLYLANPLKLGNSYVYPNNKMVNTESAFTFNWMRSPVVAGISHVHHWNDSSSTSNHHLGGYICSPSNTYGLCHSNLRININSFDVFTGDTFNKEDIDVMDLKNQTVSFVPGDCYIGVEPSEVHGKPLTQNIYYSNQ